MSTENQNNNHPKKHIWDKLIMGAIIGGAIGSVVGASIAPKKGKETRKDIVDAVKTTKKSSIVFFKKIKKIFKFGKKENSPAGDQNRQYRHAASDIQIKKIPTEEKEIK